MLYCFICIWLVLGASTLQNILKILHINPLHQKEDVQVKIYWRVVLTVSCPGGNHRLIFTFLDAWLWQKMDSLQWPKLLMEHFLMENRLNQLTTRLIWWINTADQTSFHTYIKPLLSWPINNNFDPRTGILHIVRDPQRDMIF